MPITALSPGISSFYLFIITVVFVLHLPNIFIAQILPTCR